MPRVTLKVVAQQAGCSAGVVSAVLNKAKGNIGVAPATRQRVLDVAKKLNYRPNFAARALARNRTMTLGLCFAPGVSVEAGALYQMRLIQGIETICMEHGYDILLAQGNQSDSVESAMSRLASDRVDGLILLLRNELAPEHLTLLAEVKNVVSIGHRVGLADYPAVLYDNTEAMRLAVDHLFDKGYRRIGFLGECRANPHSDNVIREKAFKDQLLANALPVSNQWIHSCQTLPSVQHDLYAGQSFKEGYFGAKYIFEQSQTKPDALVGYNDPAVAGALRYLHENGYKCPQDCALIGVDDSLFCMTSTPTLSSIGQPLEAMGREAARMLMQMIEQNTQIINAEPIATKTLLPCLIPRESTGNPTIL